MPYVFHQLIAGERLAGMPGEEQQQVDLPLGELEFPGVEQHAPSGRVDLEAVESERWLGPAQWFDPSSHGVDSGHELPRGEWLDDVVIGAELQADDAV
jgi:hypothetical protein